MKILIDSKITETAEHARSLLKAIEEQQKKRPWEIMPRGIPYHTSVYPLRCDDCDKTFWSKDSYGVHIGCKGAPDKKIAGF